MEKRSLLYDQFRQLRKAWAFAVLSTKTWTRDSVPGTTADNDPTSAVAVATKFCWCQDGRSNTERHRFRALINQHPTLHTPEHPSERSRSATISENWNREPTLNENKATTVRSPRVFRLSYSNRPPRTRFPSSEYTHACRRPQL